jgi:hypothetical protein
MRGLRARALLLAAIAGAIGATAVAAAAPTLRFASPPSGLALARRSLWVSVAGDGVLLRLDARTGRRTLRLAVHRADARALGGGKLAAASDALWVAAPVHVDDDPTVGNASGWIGRVDLPRPRLRITQVHDDPPSEIAVGPAGVWVSGGRTLRRVDPTSGRVVARSRLGHLLGAVAVGANDVWVDEPNAGRLLRIDPTTRAVRASIAIGRSTAGSSLALGGTLWAATDSGVVGVDPTSGTITIRIPLAGARAIAADGGRVLAIGRGGIYAIAHGRATRLLALPHDAGDLIAVSAGIAWLGDSASNSVRRVAG